MMENKFCDRALSYVDSVSKELLLSGKVIEKSKDIIREYYENNIVSSSPRTIAGSSIYISGLFCKEKRYQQDIAKSLKISSVSVRDGIKKILESIDDRRFD